MSALVQPQDRDGSARADEVIASLRDLAARRYNATLADERRAFPPGVVLELGRLGVLGLQAPIRAGGLALSSLDALRVMEQLGAVDPSLAVFAGAHNALGLGPVLRHARPALRDEFVPVLASGGGVAASVASAEARPAGPGRFRLHGGEAWAASARGAAVVNVFARSSGGVHAFVVPEGAPGLGFGPELVTLGLRALAQGRVILDGVAVDEARLLGAPSGGAAIATEAANHARLGVVALCTGAMKRAAQAAVRSASRGGRRLDGPATQVRLAEVAHAIVTLSALGSALARRLDQGLAAPDELYLVCRIAAPELACEAIDGAVQIAGRRGCLEPGELPRLLRDARMLRAGAGPEERLGSRVACGGEVLGFLRDALGAADVADALEDASRSLAVRPATPGAWRDALLGELATAATLFAVVRASGAGSHSSSLDGAVAWTEARFAARRSALHDGRARAADGLSAAGIEAWIAELTGDVGDLLPGGPGATWEPDRWIRAEAMSPGRASPEGVATPQGVADARVREVARAWLAAQLRVPASSIGYDVPLTQLGLDSVLAIELSYVLERELGRPVDPGMVWAWPTLDALARGLATGAPAEERLDLRRYPDRAEGPLSFCEIGLFRLMTYDREQFPYNLFVPLNVAASPDVDRLRRALSLLVDRHEGLRTGFALEGGHPVRRVGPAAEIPLEVRLLPGLRLAQREVAIRAASDELRHHRFDLARPPLVRGTLLRFDGDAFLALLFNHMIVDAWSLAIVHRELAAIWRALGRGERPDLPPLPLRPSDYALASDAAFAPLFARGREAFAPWPDGGYRLPLDTPMPAAPTHEGTIFHAMIDGSLWSRAKVAAAAADLPPAATILGAFQVALHRHARRGDVAFTVVRGNRRQPELEPMVASLMYGETFEGTLTEGEPWASVLQRTRPVVVEQRRGRMPYNMIMQPPSMRVVVNFHNFAAAAGDDTAPFAYMHENRYPYLWAVWDVMFQILPVGDGLFCEILYRSEVLRRETIERLFAWTLQALEALASDPFAPVGALAACTTGSLTAAQEARRCQA